MLTFCVVDVTSKQPETSGIGATVDDRSNRKRARMLKELDALKEDNASKGERDRMHLWRKIQTIIGRNDDIGNEYVYVLLFPIH